MPNWCENDLMATGLEKDVESFLAFAKNQEGLIDFNKFVPQPEKITRDMISPATAADACDVELLLEWRVRHWGTESEAIDAEIVNQEVYRDEAEVLVRFETAWKPPLPVVFAMSARFPSLTFDLRYFECGSGFNGMYIAEGGEVLAHRTGAYFGNRGG